MGISNNHKFVAFYVYVRNMNFDGQNICVNFVCMKLHVDITDYRNDRNSFLSDECASHTTFVRVCVCWWGFALVWFNIKAIVC